jgi:hypothetical protein
VSPVRRGSFAFFLAAATLLGVGACSCGSSSSARPSTASTPSTGSTASTGSTTSTTGASASSGDPSGWLTAQAGQWNATLNADQNSVDAAASASGGVSGSTYFSQLSAACTKMLADAGKAKTIPGAPSAALESAWNGMLAATEVYAEECLQVVDTRSTADLTAWKGGLKSMNTANHKWNLEVSKVQDEAAASSSG